MITIINLPQRFQIVNGESPANAGIRMLPLLLVSAFGAGLAGVICSKKNISWHLLVTSNALQVLGAGLISSLPSSEYIPKEQYGYQAILGLGFGLGLSSLVIVSRVEVNDDDLGEPPRLMRATGGRDIGRERMSLTNDSLAVTMGAITQVRVLGGVIGLAIAQAVLTRSLGAKLGSILSPPQIQSLLESTGSILHFSPSEASATREVYGQAFNLQMRIVTFIAAASLIVSIAAFRRHPKSFGESSQKQQRSLSSEHINVELEVQQGSESVTNAQDKR